jgi:hypothetical protein
MAALDTGKLELADVSRFCVSYLASLTSSSKQVCISELIKRFPESPRVDCLHGLRIEAGGRLEDALKFYNIILEADESNAVRSISYLLPSRTFASPFQFHLGYLETKNLRSQNIGTSRGVCYLLNYIRRYILQRRGSMA